MNKSDEYLWRMLRINGRKPTMRDRWKAFWRLYRLAAKHDPHDAIDALRMLGFQNWVILANTDGPREWGRASYPKFLYRQMLELERRRRLYHGNIDKLKEIDSRLRRKLAEDGRELTPEQVAEARTGALKKIREKGVEIGMKLPDDDAAAWEQIREMMRSRS